MTEYARINPIRAAGVQDERVRVAMTELLRTIESEYWQALKRGDGAMAAVLRMRRDELRTQLNLH